MQAPRNPALRLVRTRLSWPPSARSPFARSGCYPRRGGLKAAWRGVTPSSSYGLMRQTIPLPAPRLEPCARGPCRLSPVPAGRWPFPTLSLRPLCRCSDPYPAALPGCTCPFLHRGHRPHPTGNGFGARIYPHMAASVGSRISWLQSFDHLRVPALARPPSEPCERVSRTRLKQALMARRRCAVPGRGRVGIRRVRDGVLPCRRLGLSRLGRDDRGARSRPAGSERSSAIRP